MDTQAVTLTIPSDPQELSAVRTLFQEYADSLGVDLCFQGFEAELAELPGEYGPPRGRLLLAWVGDALAGCCALRPLDNCDYPNAGEMKRLYVRKAFRAFGIGRELAEATLDAARQIGYTSVVLDTLNDMEAESWQHMLCVEAAAIDAAVVVAPGQCWQAAQTLKSY